MCNQPLTLEEKKNIYHAIKSCNLTYAFIIEQCYKQTLFFRDGIVDVNVANNLTPGTARIIKANYENWTIYGLPTYEPKTYANSTLFSNTLEEISRTYAKVLKADRRQKLMIYKIVYDALINIFKENIPEKVKTTGPGSCKSCIIPALNSAISNIISQCQKHDILEMTGNNESHYLKLEYYDSLSIPNSNFSIMIP